MAKRGRPSLKNVSTAALRAEVARRANEFALRHAQLLREIHEVESEVRAAGLVLRASSNDNPYFSTRSLPRSGNAMTLADALVRVMRGKIMSPSEAAEAVLRDGYKTAAKNFRLVVNSRLFTMPQFKKVGHGKYSLAAGSSVK
jgi:hypothetical protein